MTILDPSASMQSKPMDQCTTADHLHAMAGLLQMDWPAPTPGQGLEVYLRRVHQTGPDPNISQEHTMRLHQRIDQLESQARVPVPDIVLHFVDHSQESVSLSRLGSGSTVDRCAGETEAAFLQRASAWLREAIPLNPDRLGHRQGSARRPS